MTSLPLSWHHVTFARTTWRWICMTLPQVKILWRCSNPTLTSYQNNGCCCSLLLTLAWSGWIGETAVPVAVHLPESGSLTILWKSVIIPTPPPYKYGGGGILDSLPPSVRMSICHPVCVSNFIWTIPPELLNHFQPNLVWWCIIMRQAVMQKKKKWFAIFKVKVTVGPYIVKIWLFLLYFLNFWSVCNQTCFDSAVSWTRMSCEKMYNWVRGHGYSGGLRYEKMFVQMISFESQNILLLNLVWWCSISSWNVVQKKIFSIFKVKVTARAHMIKIWLSVMSSELLTLCQPNLVWWYIIISQIIFWEKLDYCIQGQGHSEGSEYWWMFVQNDQIISSLPNSYCDASSWARVSCKKIGLLFSRSRSQQGLIWSKYDSF